MLGEGGTIEVFIDQVVQRGPAGNIRECHVLPVGFYLNSIMTKCVLGRGNAQAKHHRVEIQHSHWLRYGWIIYM